MAALDRRFLAALGLLVVNDWLLKPAFGNWITGKLSDFAGVIVLTVLLGALFAAVDVPRRQAAFVGALMTATSLLAVKLSHGAATAVESAFGRVGMDWHIVVDPTDAIALVALPAAVAIVLNPKPIVAARTAARVAFAAGCLACAASGTEGPARFNFVEAAPDGSVILGRDETFGGESQEIDTFIENQETGHWRHSNSAVETIDWTLTTESCDPNDPQVCIRLLPASRVEVSTDGGATFEAKWEADDGQSWLPERSSQLEVAGRPSFYEATDIAWAADGRAYIAMNDRYPVVREVDGSFTPSIADLHPFPMAIFGFMTAGWFLVAAAARMASERGRWRGASWIAAAGIVLVAGGLIATAAEGFGLLAAILFAIPGAFLFAVIGVFRAFRGGGEDVVRGSATVPIVRLLWPFIPLVLLAFAWDYDLVSLAAMVVAMVGTVIAGGALALPQLAGPTDFDKSTPAAGDVDLWDG